MKPGDLIQTSSIRIQYWPEKGWDQYTANKKEGYVFIFLGVEPRDGSKPLDPNKRLNELGWVKTDKLCCNCRKGLRDG